MSLLKHLGALLGLFAFAASKDRPASPGSSVDPYSIAPLPGDIVVNGGFEQGFTTDWSVSGPDLLTGRFCEASVAFSGTCLGSFGATGSPGSLSQTIITAPNTDYIVNFHLQSESNFPPNSFAFKWGSVQYYSIQNDGLHDYQLHTFGISTTSGGPVVITFEARNDNSFFDLDDVSVVVLPVPCDPNFYEFDPQTGDIKAESGKIYPGPPQPDSTFPVITDAGDLEFNFLSDAISQTLPRVITMGLAPSAATQSFDGSLAACQFQDTQAFGCPSTTNIGFVFSTSDASAIQDDFETLFVKQCVTRTVAADSSTVTYSGYVFTLYMDAYNLGNRWSELKPISFSMTLPYTSTATTTAIVDVVSDVVAVEYQPLEVINQGTGSNPVIQFTTVARSYYPFVAYGTGASYTPPSSASTPISDPSASSHGTCILYRPNGEVASTSTFCDANAGLCTVECTRIIALTAPACDLSGYDWTFTFSEFQDYSTTADATTPVSDSSLTPFTEELLFDNTPVWNVCPTADASDYSRFIHSDAVHGHYDTSTGDAIPDPTTAAAINTPLNFGFKIFVQPDPSGNPDSSSATKIYRARLTEMEVTRPDSTNFFLVGSASNPTVGGNGGDQGRVTGLTFTPNPSTGPVFDMFISPQGAGEPDFASIQVSFTPKVGNPSDSMLYYSDSSAPVTLTITFAGVISLFADGSTPSKRDIHFRRQITLSPNGTYANPNQIINSTSAQNSTTIVIEVPKLAKAINAATIAGSVVGGLVGLGLLAVAFVLFKRSKKSNDEFVISSEKLESGSL